jgi:hypothetical protein
VDEAELVGLPKLAGDFGLTKRSALPYGKRDYMRRSIARREAGAVRRLVQAQRRGTSYLRRRPGPRPTKRHLAGGPSS